MRVPLSLEKGAESLERVVRAVETQNAVSDQVMELKGLLMATREEILKMVNEREQIGRELRLMSRKIESLYLLCAGGMNVPGFRIQDLGSRDSRLEFKPGRR